MPPPLTASPASGFPLPRCPLCIYCTHRPAALECHLRTHWKLEHRCRICQGLWPDQASLEAHVRGHRLGNHYRCEQCGYLSKTANKLIEHVRVHTGERPFHCDRCSYSCKRKDNLNLHKKLKHAPRLALGCRACPFSTTHALVFSRHLKKHQSCGAGGTGEGEGQEEEAAVPPLRRTALSQAPMGGGSAGLTASQALQSVALSITLGQGRPRDAASPQPRPSLGGPSSRRPAGQSRSCERLIPLTALFSASNRFTFHPRLLSGWRPEAPPLLFSPPTAASPACPRSPPSPTSHKHSFLAYLGLMERAKTV